VHVVYKGNNRILRKKKLIFFCEMLTSLQYKCVNKQTNTLSPSPKGFQSPSPRTSEKFADSDSDSDVRKALTEGTIKGFILVPRCSHNITVNCSFP
jgi:hypothetical protein